MKTLRTAPFALLALVLALAIVGSSCSATDPVALQVGDWQLSTKDFEDQLNSFYDAYSQATSESEADTALKVSVSEDPTAPMVEWSTQFTAQFLNDQLSLQLAELAVEERGLEVTQDDLDAARSQLETNYADESGQSVFGVLTESYQQALIEGVAAQTVLQEDLLARGTSDEALRAIYDSSGDVYSEPQACASHILILAGEPDGQTTPSDADYATALAKIVGIQAELDGATNFAEVAAANSEDGSGEAGGDLGCAAEGSYVTEFDEAVWSQPIGEVGEPVKTVYGYHLVLVRSRGLLTFEDAKEQLAAQVEENPDLLLQAELARIAGDTDIYVDGRYGQFDEATAQIIAPAGAEEPSTTTTTGLESLLGTGAQ